MSYNHSLAPNPVPGMKWGAIHFKQEQAWTKEICANYFAATRSAYGFGLFVGKESAESLFDLRIEGNTLRLSDCYALTPDGALIIVCDNTLQPVVDLSQKKPGVYEVFVVADLAETEPFGVADPTEIPRRQPFCLPKVWLELHSVNLNQNPECLTGALKVGIVECQSGVYTLTGVIPPCLQIGAHSTLLAKYRKYCKIWKDLDHHSRQIARKTKLDSQHRVLYSLYRMAEGIGLCLSQHRFAIRNLGARGRVETMIQHCVSLAATVEFYLESLENQSEVLNLMSHYTQSMPAFQFEIQGFKDRINKVVELENSPYCLTESFQMIDDFFDHFSIVWRRLGEATQIADNTNTKGIRIFN